MLTIQILPTSSSIFGRMLLRVKQTSVKFLFWLKNRNAPAPIVSQPSENVYVALRAVDVVVSEWRVCGVYATEREARDVSGGAVLYVPGIVEYRDDNTVRFSTGLVLRTVL